MLFLLNTYGYAGIRFDNEKERFLGDTSLGIHLAGQSRKAGPSRDVITPEYILDNPRTILSVAIKHFCCQFYIAHVHETNINENDIHSALGGKPRTYKDVRMWFEKMSVMDDLCMQLTNNDNCGPDVQLLVVDENSDRLNTTLEDIMPSLTSSGMSVYIV